MAEAVRQVAASRSSGKVLRGHALLEKFWEAVGLSVLWVLGCLPVLTAATSTMALFQIVRQRRRGDYRPVGRAFWEEFIKAPLARAVVSIVVVLALFGATQTITAGITVVDPAAQTIVQAAGLIGAITVLGAVVVALPLQAEFNGSFLQMLRMTVAVAFGKPRTTLAAVLLTAAIGVAVFLLPPLLLVAGWVWASLLTALSRAATMSALRETAR